MLSFLASFVDPSGLTPHGFCLSWEPGLIWLHAISDGLTALAYYSIPLALVAFTRRRRDLSFPWVFWLFAAFIMSCGTTHAFAALTLWVPAYWPDGVVKALTAALSLTTAVALWPLIPKALAVPSPTALRRANAVLHLQAKLREVTAQQLAESEARYRSLFTRAPIAMHSLDRDRRIVEVSDQWLEMLGYAREEVIGRDASAFQTPESVASMAADWDRLVRQGGGRDLERQFIRRGGELLDVLLSYTIEPDDDPERGWRSICVLTDVTGRKRTEAALRLSQERLRQAEKMTALGQLAGGIAHDFNNMLQAAQGAAALIARNPADAARIGHLSRVILDATERGSAVTRRLLVFSRAGDLRAEPVDAARLLTGMADILGYTLGGRIDLRVEAPPGLPPLLADKGQLETVLINLATNARDAMAGAGTLVLAAAAETLVQAGGPLRPPDLSGLPAGQYVRLSVTDSGRGMDAATLARVREPFFTTKPVGQGTGLGLSVAQGFAEQSGGALQIDSEPGRGTTVSLWLPLAEDAMTGSAAPAGDEADRAGYAAPRARLLVVDDDDMIREVIAAQLEAAGFAVLPAASAAEALALLEAGEALDLILSDLSMPGMDGLTLIGETRRRRPGLPAVLLTGYATAAVEFGAGGATDGGITVLHKPIQGKALASQLATLLQAPHSSNGA